MIVYHHNLPQANPLSKLAVPVKVMSFLPELSEDSSPYESDQEYHVCFHGEKAQ
ncbi:hypothetical protein [Ktedonobacter racemifer]|uniref:Uncharacterized protein n=1 Tax=Ktedonobacter racemifer DSM 44963 TaxID=485913 RepID=D6TDE2_KTERA|nr:hypothetical protein [Ktedonobacter racemifer]EFH88287.1 hypothetical protein Krac_9714 [Ktedonobacter racemifer DSM 44963]